MYHMWAHFHSELVALKQENDQVGLLDNVKNDLVMKKKENRTQWLHVRLSPDELKRLGENHGKVSGEKRSEYIRRMILSKPHIGSYRNHSLDAFMEEMILLRKVLNGIANNFNQAVHTLHMTDHFPEKKKWFVAWEMERRTLVGHVAEIRQKVNSIADEWLR